MFINLLHIVLIVPILIYVGIQRAATPEFVYNGILIMGAIVLAYHAYKTYTKWVTGSSKVLVNVVHFALIAPILMLIGYYKKDTSKQFYDAILLLAFSALGYHSYYLIMQLTTVSGAL